VSRAVRPHPGSAIPAAGEPGRGGELTFGVVWLGQLVSLTGSVLTEFAIGVWVFQRTGSTTLFALINLFIFVPPIVVAPFAGALADRHSRRGMMILANCGGGLTVLALALLVFGGRFDVGHAYLITLLLSVCSTLLAPAFSASIVMLVGKRHLGRANGMVQFAQSVPRVLAPPASAVLLVTVGLGGVALLDCASFAITLLTLLPLTIPQPAASGRPRRRLLVEALDGLRYIVPRRDLLLLLLFFAVVNVDTGFFFALATPLTLSFTSPAGLGVVTGVGGAGFVAGSILMSVWGGPRRPIAGVLGAGIVLGLALSLMGSRPSVVLVGAASFVLFVCVTVANVCNSVIWQSRVPPELQGRVIGSIRTISFSTLPLAFVVAGPLADRVFDPLLVPGGPLTASAGAVIGVGPGRGIGLLLLVAGLAPIAAGLAGLLSRTLLGVDRLRVEPALSSP